MSKTAVRQILTVLTTVVAASAAFSNGPIPAAEPSGPIRLTDVTRGTGIDFRHTDGSSGRRYIIESVSAGLALFDYDRDGDVDVYFLNGTALPGKRVTSKTTNALFRNDGDWHFKEVTVESGLGDTGYGLGVAIGDYDNDGALDVYLNNFGPNVLYRNNGDGTFTDVTAAADVENGNKVGAGACFVDIDADGDLDLYVANYVDFTFQNHRTVRFNGHPAYVGPMDYQPTSDTLYRNNGDGTFSDISEASGVAAHKGTGMGTTCCDFDHDGDTDVFVGNDVAGNSVFQNDGKGKFEEVGLFSGLAYDLSGNAQGTMGVDSGDYNNDGLIDFYVTSYQRDYATLYKNLGDGFFEDVTRVTGAGQGTLAHVTWGCGIVDFDNDGHRDIFVACGHLHDNVELFDTTTSYHARNIVLRNEGGGKFVDVSAGCGDGLHPKLSSRGVALDDLDNDGDIDGVVLNSRSEPTLFRNDSSGGNHWLQIRLRGVDCNRDGIGSQVTVKAGNLLLVDEVHSGRSYQGHHGLRLHFGLGKHDRADRVEVKWLGGGVDVIEGVTAGQLLVIQQTASR